MLFSKPLVLLCTIIFGTAHASPSGTISQPGCPSQVSVANGDFETGKVAPWTSGYLGVGATGDAVNVSVVSPGYKNSKYALQMNFATGNNKFDYAISQSLNGKFCWGYYYNISFAYNWVNYTGPGDNYCGFSIHTGYSGTENVTTHYASNKSGWHFDSYVVRDEYSHCKSLGDSLFFFFDCYDANKNLTVPSFALRLDNLKIQTLPYSPLPYPTDPYGEC